MKKPLMDIDQPGMEVSLNAMKPGTGFVWSQLFPLKHTPKFDLKGIEGEDGIPVSADRVAFNAKAPKKTRKNVGTWEGKLGKIAISREKDELQINDYQDLRLIAANNTEDKAMARDLVDMVYNDLDFCAKGMDAKIEIDALGIGSSGKQVYKKATEGENVTADEINFNVPKENFGGAKVVWTDAAKADGLKDLADWAAKIAKQGKKRPRYAFMTQEKFNELIAQVATGKRLFPRYDELAVTSDMITLEAVNRYMIAKGFPQILTFDSYATVEANDGTQTTVQPWNNKVVTLSPEPRLGYTYFKTVPKVVDTEALQAYGAYYKVTRYSELNPMKEVTMAEAYIQPALSNRGSLVFLNTENAGSWGL